MTDLHKLLSGIAVGSFAQVLTFLQLQGQIKWTWVKNHYWLMVLLGIPVSMLFMYSVKCFISAFNGQMWPSRLIGFSIGTVVFTIMSFKFFDEPITAKTGVCLVLALAILAIQLFIK